MNNYYFISDLHIGEGSRRTLTLRGFGSDWQKHTEFVKNNINSVCDKSDWLYILGDVGGKGQKELLENFFKSLKPQIKVCIGNHDDKRQLRKLKDKGVIQDVKEMYSIKLHDMYFDLCHYPLIEWGHFFENGYHLHGHCHNNLPELPYRILDVGIDSIGYKPISEYEIISRLKNKNNVDKNRNRILWI